MNKLKIEKQETAITALLEGCSIRSVERMTGIHRDTIMRLLVRVGNGCQKIMDETMRDLPCKYVQVDEIWAYVGKKQKQMTKEDDYAQTGDMWTYVAIDPESKVVPNFLVGKRNAQNTHQFVSDLSSRLANRVQLSSDALPYYIQASEKAFGADVDYGQIVKSFEAEPVGQTRYSPSPIVRADKRRMSGNPDFSKISTSHVERQNLTMRMSMRRFTRLTNGFSKKLENLKAAVALHFAHYNFVRIHKSLRVTPAIEIGLSSRVWTVKDLINFSN